jgi:transcriptional regulator with XRE-family HTH domain
MSTIISTVSANMLPAKYISLFGMPTERTQKEDLADFVMRVRNEKGISQRGVEINSGGTISKGYVGQIENRTVLGDSVTPQKLRALAKGLQASEDEVFAVARGKSLSEAEIFDSEIGVLFKGFDELSDKDKAEMLATVRMLGSEIQRRRPKKPPDKDKGKGKK